MALWQEMFCDRNHAFCGTASCGVDQPVTCLSFPRQAPLNPLRFGATLTLRQMRRSVFLAACRGKQAGDNKGTMTVTNNETIVQLATRMNVDDTLASQWLQAVLDVLSGNLGEMGPMEFVETDDDGFVEVDIAPVLRPVTAESWEALRSKELEMNRFPFRFGREGRMGCANPKPGMGDRRGPRAKPNNDHYLQDRGTPLNISREHFQIEMVGNGAFELVDRGSACGTIVSGNVVGGEYTNGRIPLYDGDTIVVGTPHSPDIFTFHIQPRH